jgi:hypothetical protein
MLQSHKQINNFNLADGDTEINESVFQHISLFGLMNRDKNRQTK